MPQQNTISWRLYTRNIGQQLVQQPGQCVYIRSKTARHVGQHGVLVERLPDRKIPPHATNHDQDDDDDDDDDGFVAAKDPVASDQHNSKTRTGCMTTTTTTQSNGKWIIRRVPLGDRLMPTMDLITANPQRMVPIYTTSNDDSIITNHHEKTYSFTKEVVVVLTTKTWDYRHLAAAHVQAGDAVWEIGTSTGETSRILWRHLWQQQYTSGRTNYDDGDLASPRVPKAGAQAMSLSSSWMGFDTSPSMVAHVNKIWNDIQTNKHWKDFPGCLGGSTDNEHDSIEWPPPSSCVCIDALQDPDTACKLLQMHFGRAGPTVILLDIGGNRPMQDILAWLSWILDGTALRMPLNQDDEANMGSGTNNNNNSNIDDEDDGTNNRDRHDLDPHMINHNGDFENDIPPKMEHAGSGRIRLIVVKNQALFQALHRYSDSQGLVSLPTQEQQVTSCPSSPCLLPLYEALKNDLPRCVSRQREELHLDLHHDVMMSTIQQRRSPSHATTDWMGACNGATQYWKAAAGVAVTIPHYPHPLQAPKRMHGSVPICRYHNYHPDGCRKAKISDDACHVDVTRRVTTSAGAATAKTRTTSKPFADVCRYDHTVCHFCLAPGHVALACSQYMLRNIEPSSAKSNISSEN